MRRMDEEMPLTSYQAFVAMQRFLAAHYERTDGDMATLMADIQIDRDGMTNDPAAWNDWSNCVRAVLKETRT